ncbi:MAG: hypothetical protein KME43_02735 [Myxacorys chilensis ATA2-1-KO14]|nr:hypothetical protein [Myxacorys chilensis ATA2-1-KO14]
MRQGLESTQQNSESINLENSNLQRVVRPDSRGRIEQLYDKTTEPDALTYSFQNQSDQEIPFLFKHHAAISAERNSEGTVWSFAKRIAIEPSDEILLPNCLIESGVRDSRIRLSYVPDLRIEIQALGKPVSRLQSRIQHSLTLRTCVGLLVCSDEGGAFSLHKIEGTEVPSDGDVVPPP